MINDRYEIIKSIGEGGMANVYLAKDTFLDRKVAVKVLRGDLATDEKFIRRFQREAYAASTLSHPNIVEMYDVGEDNGTYYIVMEYIEGRTLKQLLKKRGSLTAPEVVDIMLQLTDGIAHAHDMYIIHRDLKPQNIMISDDGKIKITDFGIAMALNSTQLTQTNSVMGSVHYLPPEQASGKGATTKSDIYSMGIMLFELLTGKLPFKGENAVEIALKHLKDEIPSVKKINSNIPQSLENIILKSTAKNPKNRYDDVKEMYNDLKVCLNEENLNQDPYVYKYPEHVTEEDTNLKEVDEDKEKKEEEKPVAKKIDEKNDKKKKRSISSIIIVFLVLVLLGGIGAIFVILYPTFKKSDNVKIPDVTGLSVSEAEKVLTGKGFIVTDETKKEASDKFEKGDVVGTDPAIGRSRAKGTKITIIESLGKNDTYRIENYVGKNYLQVQTELEKVYKMKVVIEKKEVDITEDMDLQLIIDQDLKPGEEVIISEDNPQTITLYIPDAYEQYPDFVADGWTISEVQDFAEKYELSLEIREMESDEYPEGTIIKQSRTGKIVNGASLVITITKLPKEPEKEDTGENTGDNIELTTDENENKDNQ
ncbi:MAG: Stk1 family PASTA domain-containing Ser/Thr kinase [Bacilli bacterium]|nr:Stk1 family PASTA domain-containing Ser/Thr kinase [Bacilli bacterium]